MRVLCVAEKPSISKSISQILSGGQFATHSTRSQYIKNYEFNYPQTNSFYTVTCVSGHLMGSDFRETHRKWTACDPFDLFDAPIETSVDKDKKAIEDNLLAQARRADTLMIWTDCDREGEHIGLEVVRVCRKAKANIVIKRARFSAIIAQQIHHAAQHPVELDRAQAAAVEARIILDLRIGAAFTRMQTLTLQNRLPRLADDKSILSYGPCQFPTLGFVVQKWKLVKSFVSEPFWYIHLSLNRNSEETTFTWKRGHIFDDDAAVAIYDYVLSDPLARVLKVTKKGTKKWKPLPLTTVELQKSASRLLRLTPKKVLDIAEKLYQQGFLSYPRTETDQFDAQFDFQTLIQKQTVDPDWGAFATSLGIGGFSVPRKGKNNDKAHPPIHPTAHVGNLVGDEKKVYEFITRRFLACCSKDAEGWQTTVDVLCGGEYFYATGLVVLEKNYLLVYPYDKWVGHEVPNFEEGEEFQPSVCELREGKTSKPSLLTEADLVTLMDKNGIGTDATIAQHIQTIIDRDYVIEKMEGTTKYLIPSKLGIGLIEGYNQIGLGKSLSKPQLRRETERNMVQVCEGAKTKADMLEEAIVQYKEMFIIAKREFEKVVSSVRRYLESNEEDQDNHDGGTGGGDPGPDGGDRGTRRRGQAPRSRASAPRSRGSGRGARRTARTTRTSDSDDDFNDRPPRTRPSQIEPGSSRRKPPSSVRGASKLPSDRNAGPSNLTRESLNQLPSRSSANVDIRCNCDVAAAQRTVTKESVSKGKKFWTCGNDSSCGFFQWFDDIAGPSVVPTKRSYSARQDSAPGDSNRLCKCNITAVQRSVIKEGANQGRKFWVCPNAQGTQCGYFEWDDQPPQIERSNSNASRSAVEPGGSSGMVGECFKCNQQGHWASACPNGGSDNKRRRSTSSANPVSASGKCFKCQQQGHLSSACPNAGISPSNSCFKCGGSGHWSNTCPGEGAQRSTPGTRGSGERRGRGRGASRARRTRGGKKRSSFGAPDE